jgi:hypothetical protein
MPPETITGTIAGLRDYGGLVLVFLDAEDGRVIPVPMDRRAFRHLLEGEACGPDELIGRSVSFNGDLMADKKLTKEEKQFWDGQISAD